MWLLWPWPRAQCQRWGLALGPQWGALTEQKIPQFSSWSHRRQITMSPGREVEEEAQMCVCLTSVHSKTSGHLFVFVCVRVCTPVLVCALRAVCLCLSLSLYVSGPLSQCVWLLVYACLCDGVWVCMCGSVSAYGALCVLDLCMSKQSCKHSPGMPVCICGSMWP